MSLNPKLLLPIGLGLSLVTVTAVVVYYIFKKDDEEGNEKGVKTTRVNVIEINVPKSIVPALIGRSGSNIKDIERKSGAMIHFKKFNDKDYDTCIIRGRSQNTQLAETLVHDFITQQPVIVEDILEVPGWACGRIIGTGGENINEISHTSGARVKIESGGIRDNATQRSVMIKGTAEQIAHARKLIETCVAQEKCRREIESSKRSPRHAPASPLSPGSSAASAAQSPQGAPSTQSEMAQLPGDRRTKYKRPEGAGAPIEVYVSAVSSPSRFWVQMVGPQVTQLDELVAHMTDYYGNKENREQHTLSNVSVGQVVAAVFRHDGRWYRARVDNIQPNEFDAKQQVADVFYLDYGDSEYVAVHELCELRADLLRLRFQAMECFLAGVKPAGPEDDVTIVTSNGQKWDKWPPQAVERFEDLTQVAKWKPLVSRTCTYKKMATGVDDKEKEVPGIKLFDVTEAGEVDIGQTLISEGFAVLAATSRVTSPRTSPPPAPFGDLGNSMVLTMLEGRASSVPKNHKDDQLNVNPANNKENDRLSTSKSTGALQGDKLQSISNFDMAYPNPSNPKPQNGSTNLLNAERQHADHEGSTDTLVAPGSPMLARSQLNEFKANMNRIDSHHNLEALNQSNH